jgi:hypothetical protein
MAVNIMYGCDFNVRQVARMELAECGGFRDDDTPRVLLPCTLGVNLRTPTRKAQFVGCAEVRNASIANDRLPALAHPTILKLANRKLTRIENHH